MNFLLNSYFYILETASPALVWLLARRLSQGKEDAARISERRGKPGMARPAGSLIWIHGASVGEAQSTLIIIEKLKQYFPDTAILLTTGTVTSARYLEGRLPAGVIHQYYPLDCPRWVKNFLSHWKPDFVLWMESELWPAMLCTLQEQKIPVMLLNARLSARSQKRWQHISGTARILLQSFSTILTQTDHDATLYRALGAENVKIAGNLKFAAADLPADQNDLQSLTTAMQGRPLWLYASTHKGEEEMACRIHKKLLAEIPDLLTIIVPRHPERRQDIVAACAVYGLNIQYRSDNKTPPAPDTHIYMADTLGELGLFYRLAPVACIGRSFSDDGGGGHNPIEAAQLGCVVIHGPYIQNLREIYHDMDKAGAALCVNDEADFTATIKTLLMQPDKREEFSKAGLKFTQTQRIILEEILEEILPRAREAGAA